jgi:hypothetical protein
MKLPVAKNYPLSPEISLSENPNNSFLDPKQEILSEKNLINGNILLISKTSKVYQYSPNVVFTIYTKSPWFKSNFAALCP